MNRRNFIKSLTAVAIIPALPVPMDQHVAVPHIASEAVLPQDAVLKSSIPPGSFIVNGIDLSDHVVRRTTTLLSIYGSVLPAEATLLSVVFLRDFASGSVDNILAVIQKSGGNCTIRLRDLAGPVQSYKAVLTKYSPMCGPHGPILTAEAAWRIVSES